MGLSSPPSDKKRKQNKNLSDLNSQILCKSESLNTNRLKRSRNEQRQATISHTQKILSFLEQLEEMETFISSDSVTNVYELVELQKRLASAVKSCSDALSSRIINK